jgi:hypothetical protein
MNIRFKHFRRYELDQHATMATGQATVRPMPKGGATVAWAFFPETDKILFHFARCSRKDTFCKRVGREEAFKAMTEKTFIIDRRMGLTPLQSIMAYMDDYNLLRRI